MQKMFLLLMAVAMAFGFGACKQAPKETAAAPMRMQSDYPAPPMAAVNPQTFTEHGYTRVDDYYWLKDKTDPQVTAYLNAENAYADTVLAHTKALQETLFSEMKGRIKEDDTTVPYLENGYYYYSRTETGKQYRIHCRKKGDLNAPEEVILDENKEAEGRDAFVLGGYRVSPDNNIMAYASNYTGSSVELTLRFRDLRTGQNLPDEIENTGGGAWADDNKTIFYTRRNEALRANRVYKHQLGSKAADPLIYEEKDELFSVYVNRSKSGAYIFMGSSSFTSSEYRMLPANQPNGTFAIFVPREKDVEYQLEHHRNQFILRVKDVNNKNYKIMAAPLTGYADKKNWKDLIPHDPKVKIEGMEVFDQFLSVEVRSEGLQELRVMSLKDGSMQSVAFPEPVYTVFSSTNREYASTQLRYGYMSLNRPNSTYDYDMVTGKSTLLKQQEIPSGFNPDDYEVKRLWATAPDGVKVPMALVHKKGMALDGNNPTLLYSYGSYGYSTDPYFNANVFSLVDRGFVYAIAQIRGGSEMGEQWYEDGKLMKKKNTFTDFIACAEELINQKYTSPRRLAINGGSAGGLLMGAVVNMRPDLFQAVVAQVPFVDVINTMLDPTLPLTTQEYEQWGNPNEKEAYDYIRSYSPYDNIEKKDYPNILATGGINDSQVLFHEPAKWVAKLRAMKTDDNITLLRINMQSGHGGATGRFDRLKEVAFNYAFIMDRLGVKG
ncbi:MAG: S9 family peptidase [Saprospiraceae bacterium]|nr:S9 family peptidase [Saprospiraceae bacterium]